MHVGCGVFARSDRLVEHELGTPGLVFDEFEYLTVEVLASRHCDRAVGAEIGLGGECGGIPLKKARPSSSGGAVDIPASVATRSDTLCTP